MSIFGDSNQINFVADFSVEKIIPRDKDTKIYTKTAREAVKQSIEHFGIIEPLVINSDNYLMHGGLRLEVIKELGLTETPVIIHENSPKETGEADLYHMMADRMVEWDKWNTIEATKILTELADSSKDKEYWNNYFKKIGWFTPDTSKKPTATMDTLDLIAHETTKWADTKHYHFNEAQVLYIEALRRKVQQVREELIERDEIIGGVVEKYRRHMQEEENKQIAGEAKRPQAEVKAELEKKIKINKKPVLGERAKIQLKGESQKVHKVEKNNKRMMDKGPWLNLAITFLDFTPDEAEEKWETLSTKEFNKLCRKAIEEDKQIAPPVSKVHPLAVGVKND